MGESSKTTRRAAEAAEKARKGKQVKDDQVYPSTAPLQNGGVLFFDKEARRTKRMRPEEIVPWLETLQDPLRAKVLDEMLSYPKTIEVVDLVDLEEAA